jgi:hypothetical protein
MCVCGLGVACRLPLTRTPFGGFMWIDFVLFAVACTSVILMVAVLCRATNGGSPGW